MSQASQLLALLRNYTLQTVKSWPLADDRDESHALSVFLMLVALKLLSQTASPLPPSTQSTNIKTSGAAELCFLIDQLYQQFLTFCPPNIAYHLPRPEHIPSAWLGTAWNNLEHPQMAPLWSDECTLGYAYQFFSIPRRKAAQSSIQTADKTITLTELINFTQLYTPDWIVDFLLQNTLLSQWSGLTDTNYSSNNHWPFSLHQHASTANYSASKLTLLDPACGAGHFLLRAFDLLLSLYKAEGWSTQDAIKSILANNLAGTDIDPIALWVLELGLFVKCLRLDSPGQYHFDQLAAVHNHNGSKKEESLLGSLYRGWSKDLNHPLSRQYRAVATNPPYIGRRLLDRQLKSELKKLYPGCHQDLCTAFVARALELLCPGGRLGVITQASTLFLPTYATLRQRLVEKEKLVAVVEIGPGAFPLQSGEKINSALMIVETNSQSQSTSDTLANFIDITSASCQKKTLIDLATSQTRPLEAGCLDNCHHSEQCYTVDPQSFKKQHKYAFNYKFPPALLKLIKKVPAVSALADVRQGLATTDNRRFVRYWWDVDPASIGKRWVPYVKGAGQERWYSPVEHVVDWEDNGQAIKQTISEKYPYLKGKTSWVVKNESCYFQPGLCFSFVNANNLAVRRLPANCIFDVGSSAIFADPPTIDFLLGYLNSSLVGAAAKLFNPTINFQVGDIKRLPVVEFKSSVQKQLSEVAEKCCFLKKSLYSMNATSLNGGLPQEIESIFDGQDIGTIWQQYVSSAPKAISSLHECELNINQLIFKCLADSAQLDSQDISILESWLEKEHAQQSQLSHLICTQEDFAHLVLYYTLIRSMDNGSASYSARLRTHGISPCFSLLLPLSDKQKIASVLGLKLQTIQWLESTFAMPLTSYLIGKFGKTHRRWFHGSPLLFCLSVADSEVLLITSSMAMRHLSSTCNTNLEMHWSKAIELWHKQAACHGAAHFNNSLDMQLTDLLARASKICSETVRKLSSTYNWTGADLEIALRQLQT